MSEQDAAKEAFLKQMAQARAEGKPMGELLQMAAQFMEVQPAEAETPQPRQMIDALKALSSHGSVLGAMQDAVKAGDEKEGRKQLFTLHDKLRAAQPPEEREAERQNFLEVLARSNAEHAEHVAAHKKERVSRGLSEEAGSGKPEPRILVHGLPQADLPYEDKPRSLGAMIEAIEEAKRERDQITLSRLPIGQSRLGGLPDLPPGVPWPTFKGRKLPFVAQLNLAEFSQASPKLLPEDGHLFAFALISNEEDHWPPPVAVFLHRGPAESLERAAPPADDEIWPDWGGVRVYEILPATARPKGRDAKKRSSQSGETLGWLFGKMDPVFGTPGELADSAFQDGDDWINLLAVESEGSMQWSDCGHLYFLIRRSALAKLDFSNVIAQACSS